VIKKAVDISSLKGKEDATRTLRTFIQEELDKME